MSVIRLVTFDVTNTIIRVLGSVGQNYSKVAALYNTTVDASKLDVTFRSTFKRYNILYPNYGVTSGLTPSKWWTGLVIDSFKDAGSDDRFLETIAEHLYVYFSTSKGWEVLPMVHDTLTLLKERDVKVGAISNFDDRLENILEELDLRHYFDFVLSSAVVKIAKPDAEIFKMALNMADVAPETALHIGDDIKNDYEGARNVGMHGVLFLDKNKEVPNNVDAKYIISQLEDVMKYV